MKRIVIGISGGIDSAVSAFLLKKQGYEVYGLHLNIHNNRNNTIPLIKKISDLLGISVEIQDAHNLFSQTTISYFTNELLKGNTPSPCAICNPQFKWKLLEEFANLKDTKSISTGHYIQKTQIDDYWFLKKGLDFRKDQSYYLWGLSQNIIRKMENPLGQITKTDVRNIALDCGLDFLLEKKESNGLCFAMEEDYDQIVKRYVPDISKIGCGEVIDSSGKIIGSHKGYIYYTIGQKRGLDLKDEKGYCVTGIDASSNRIIAGFPENLWKKEFEMDRVILPKPKILNNFENIQVKVRGIGLNPEGNCRLIPKSNYNFHVLLDQLAWAPAPGQPAVFYSNDLVIGGGIIC